MEITFKKLSCYKQKEKSKKKVQKKRKKFIKPMFQKTTCRMRSLNLKKDVIVFSLRVTCSPQSARALTKEDTGSVLENITANGVKRDLY